MTLREYWRLITRWWWIPVLLVVAVALLSLTVGGSARQTYAATVRFVVSVPPQQSMYFDTRLDAFRSTEYLVDDLAEVVGSRAFANLVAQELNDPSVSPEMIQSIQRPQKTHRILGITVTTGNPLLTERVAAAIGTVLVRSAPQFLLQVEGERISIQRIDEPVVTPVSTGARNYIDLAVRLALALVVGIGLALLLEYLDTSIRDAEEIDRLLGLPVLAEIPREQPRFWQRLWRRGKRPMLRLARARPTWQHGEWRWSIEHEMNDQQALDYILSFTDYERTKSARYSPELFHLSRMERLLAGLGNPHRRVRAVHVAGTKGKGSTAAMLAAVLQAAGYQVGLYTSPHLHHFRERIQINGQPIPPAAFAAQVEKIRPTIEHVMAEEAHGPVTTFEIATALAFSYFADEGVDFQILEVGLGGRLDATNVVWPLCSVITAISLDHMHILGNSIEAIAWEKAGIIKPDGRAVTAPQRQAALKVIEAVARSKGARLVRVGIDVQYLTSEPPTPILARDAVNPGQRLSVAGRYGQYDLWIPLLGIYQQENAATAVAALEQLIEQGVRIPPMAVADGLARVRWPGRLEILWSAPAIVADGAHNPDSVRRLIEAIRRHFLYSRLILVVGVSADKDLPGIVAKLVRGADVILATRSHHPRAVDPERIADLAGEHGCAAEVHDSVESALTRARSLASPDDLICATGSLFIAAETSALTHPLSVG